MSDRRTLPVGWAWAELGQLLREPLRNGHSAKASGTQSGLPTFTLTAITTGDFSSENIKLTVADPAKVSDLWVEPGDILIERANTPELVGTARLYRGPGRQAIFPDLIIRARLRGELDARYVESYLHSQAARRYFQRRAQGIAGSMPKIDQSTVEQLAVPIAPRAEQVRIVEEIEKQFTRIDAGIAALRRIRANLKRQRAAILNAACEGRLVPTEAELARAEGRSYEPAERILERVLEEQCNSLEVDGPDRASLPRLPGGWAWGTVEQTIKIIDYRGRTPPFSSEGIVHLRSSNIRNGRVVWKDLVYVSVETYHEYMTRGIPQAGDILFTTEAPLGEVAFAPTEIQFSVAQRMMILRPRPGLWSPGFLKLQLMSDSVQARIRRSSTGSTVAGVSSRNFRPIPLAIPPIHEQERIAAEAERRISIIEEAAKVVEVNLGRAERLRQAVLRQAFEGKLVPQDPTDEPASVLLERLRAEQPQPAPDAPKRRAPRRRAPGVEVQ